MRDCNDLRGGSGGSLRLALHARIAKRVRDEAKREASQPATPAQRNDVAGAVAVPAGATARAADANDATATATTGGWGGPHHGDEDLEDDADPPGAAGTAPAHHRLTKLRHRRSHRRGALGLARRSMETGTVGRPTLLPERPAGAGTAGGAR